ncbi:MAG: hypothetical protein F6K28_32335 [Microcoleus sp. SIO2G3]|nr:hypothetical protein [Microcoleus sp. SIO2G3]
MIASMQIDPLNSPHPIPWNWVLTMQAEAIDTPKLRYYRSQSLISPDGEYAAYSRIQMQTATDWMQCHVSSVLFVENLRTGDLQTITASSPLSENPFMAREAIEQGTIAILIPIAWSAEGDRVLAREFESLFCSDIASDYAVVWDRKLNRTYTIAPTRISYSNAILLGWSRHQPNHVLFQAGELGDEAWPLWSVDLSGQTIAALPEDEPITYGRVVNNVWAGPQAAR